MKKKIIIAITIILVATLALFVLPQFLPNQTPQEGQKTLSIVIKDSTSDIKILFDGEIDTTAETLADALEGAGELEMVVEVSSYGRFITSLMGVQQGTVEAGPWWLYESTNNETCKSQGMCMGIDDTIIQDGDDFTFNLTTSFN